MCELRYHLVWCPKYRRPVLEGAVAERLEALIREKVAQMGGEVLALSVQPDHVHAFLRVDTPYLSPAEVAAGLKGYTSRVLRREFPHLRSRLPT
ncbi:IS200/IS605 family transposase, partial [Thermus sp.]|uniref:IS200/IS605 family transposase n=1 Tax=Thermus sp. TaxID=275 RepID=UPI003D0E6400